MLFLQNNRVLGSRGSGSGAGGPAHKGAASNNFISEDINPLVRSWGEMAGNQNTPEKVLDNSLHLQCSLIIFVHPVNVWKYMKRELSSLW